MWETKKGGFDSWDRKKSPGGGNSNPLQYSCLDNSMTGKPGGLQFLESQRVGHC